MWLGTRFLAAAEARVHPDYRDLVLGATGTDTVLTTVFDGGWDGPHRVLRNSTLRVWEQQGRPAPGERPGEDDVVARAAGRSGSREFRRYDMTSPGAYMSGDVEAMALYAGQSVGLVRDARPAGAIVAALVEEAEAARQRVDAHRGRLPPPSGG